MPSFFLEIHSLDSLPLPLSWDFARNNIGFLILQEAHFFASSLVDPISSNLKRNGEATSASKHLTIFEKSNISTPH